MRHPYTFLSSMLLTAGLVSCGGDLQRESTPGLVLLGTGTGDSLGVSYPFLIRSAPSGKLYVSSQGSTGLIEISDSTGRFDRTLGRLGDGPGEFRHPGTVLFKGDTVFAEDYERGDLEVFSPDGRSIRRIPTRVLGNFDGVLLRGDTLLLSATLSGDSTFGLPLHIFSPDGRRLNSFGASDRSFDPQFPYSMYRLVERESDSSFWAAMTTEYSLELWDTRGVRQRQLKMNRGWFPPVHKTPESADVARPGGSVFTVHRSKEGRLWIVLSRASAHWRATAGKDTKERPMLSIADYMKYFEIVIEEIDPKSGALLGQAISTDHLIVGFLANDVAYGFDEDSAGRQVPTFWRIHFSPHPPE
jgi:hypothetical protein